MTTVSTPYGTSPLDSALALLDSRKKESYLLYGVLAIAIVLRLAVVIFVPPNIAADEADMLVNVYQILNGHGPGIFGLDWRMAPAFDAYVVAAFMLVFGKSIFVLRLVSLFFSTLALIPLYFLTRRRLSTAASAMAAFLMSTGLWYLHFSSNGWDNVHIVLYELMAVWLLSLALDRQRLWYYAASGFFVALGLYSNYSGIVTVILAALYAAFVVWQRRDQSRPILRGCAVLAAVAFIAFVPQLPSLFGNWDAIGHRPDAVSVFSVGEQQYNTTNKVDILSRQIERTARSYILMDGSLDGNPRFKPPGRSLFDPITASLFIAGLVLAVVRWRRHALWLLMFLVPLLTVQLFVVGVPNAARAVALIPAVYLLVGLTFDDLIVRPRVLRGFFQIALLVLAPLLAVYNFGQYVEWMRLPAAAEARQPAVENAEFPVWQNLQLERARDGQPGFTVSDWLEMRRNFPALAARVAQTGNQPLQVVNQPDNVPGDLAQFVLAAGRSGSGPDQFLQPRAVTVDRNGFVYVADTGNKRVVKLDPDLKPIMSWGRDGEGDGEFKEPWAIATDDAGFVYVLDAVRQAIQRFDGNGTYLSSLGADLATYRPRDMSLDPTGFLFIADTGRNRVIKLGRNGQVARTYGAPEPGNPALDQPTSAIADEQGNVYIAEPTKKRVWKLNPEGRPLLQWAIPEANTIDAPRLRMAPGGRILLTDPTRQRVGVYAMNGQLTGYWGATGQAGGQFQGAPSVGIGLGSTLYVTDPGNNRVQKFTLN